MPYRVVYVNEADDVTTIEVEDFEAMENGLIKLTIASNSEAEMDQVKYIPIHRFICGDGEELWESPDEEDEDLEEEEAGELEGEEVEE